MNIFHLSRMFLQNYVSMHIHIINILLKFIIREREENIDTVFKTLKSTKS